MEAVRISSMKVCDITQCVICLETFKEPKALPCLHTFCLQCLDNYCEEKEEADEPLECPLCRKVFTIPPDGNVNLPNNFFILQLLQVKQSTGAAENELTRNQRTCELCSHSQIEIASTSYCVECDKRICDRCSEIHKKERSFSSHQVVRKANIYSTQEPTTTFAVSYCDQHPAEPNRLYCSDCEKVTCLVCIVTSHKKHELIDVNESAKNFREQLKGDVDILSACSLRKLESIKQLEISTSLFMEKVTTTHHEISQKYEELLALIQSQMKELMEEVNVFKDKILKEVKIVKDEMETQSVIIESFKRYCVEMMNKGTACEISRAANDLHARAQELVKTQDKSDSHELSEVEIMFKPSLSRTDGAENIIGEVVYRGSIQKFASSRVLHVMPGNRDGIAGMTVLGSEIFLVREWAVQVYKSDDFTFIRSLEITASFGKQFVGIASCSHYNCLYVSDVGLKNIYRYDITNDVTTIWSVGGKCFRLSLTKCYHVLAALYFTNQIKEYTTHGSLIREISLDKSVNSPWHCVEMSTGDLVVILKIVKDHRVCIVDKSGQIIQSYDGCGQIKQSYDGSRGSGVRHEYNPCHLAIDINDNVLVADSGINNSVELLSPTLTYLRDIVIPGHQFMCPCSLHLDELNHRLYIGEGEDHEEHEDESDCVGRMFILEIN